MLLASVFYSPDAGLSLQGKNLLDGSRHDQEAIPGELRVRSLVVQ